MASAAFLLELTIQAKKSPGATGNVNIISSSSVGKVKTSSGGVQCRKKILQFIILK
jgi:hypothetical protein